MSDGRDIITITYKTVKEISSELDSRREVFTESNFNELKKEVDESLNWAKKCRNKVWLRSKEGTDLAQGCLNVVNELKENMDDGSKAAELAFNLKYKLESLAKIISTKASVMT
jgi:DNA polymerase III sliding clamp (beta) subunit (PCNA family)